MSICGYCRQIFQGSGTTTQVILRQIVKKICSTFVLFHTCRQLTKSLPRLLSQTELRHVHFPIETRSFCTSRQHSVQRFPYLSSSKTKRNSAPISAQGADSNDIVNAQKTLLWLRYIYVQTSIERWADIPGGVFLDAAYLDSAPGDKYNPAVPVVVGLHSTPGSFYDLQPVLETFVKSGCRVVAPSFPGHGYTEGLQSQYNDVFTHSTDEKSEFVRDFLLNLGIEKVDLLIAHGAAGYTALRLTGGPDTTKMFKSSALISPWPLQPFSAMKRRNLLQLLYDMWDIPLYRPMAKPLSWFFPTAVKGGATERITTVYTLKNINFSEVGGMAVALSAANFPCAVFFAEDDNYVEPALIYQLADLLGIRNENITKFTGRLDKGQLDTFPSCMVFEKGGQQQLQQTQAGIIAPVLLNLLKSVRPGFTSYS